MKIAIIGHGFVGKAVDYGFSHPEIQKIIIDPIYGSKIDKRIKNCQFIFVSVPTPMGDDGTIDDSILREVIKDIEKYSHNSIIIVKSTVIPEVIANLSDRIVYNPEFLTEKSANEQFVNPVFHILGGHPADCTMVADFYDKYSLCNHTDFYCMTIEEASFTKYAINCFLATKVLFFNQLYDAALKENNVNFSVVAKTVGADPRITPSHTKVPGFDGKQGFGGACFPKDVSAFLAAYPEMGILDFVKKTNNDYRNQYEKDSREIEQNIDFA